MSTKHSRLDSLRSMLDILYSNLESINEASLWGSKLDDVWRKQNIRDNIDRCHNEIKELEREIIAQNKGSK